MKMILILLFLSEHSKFKKRDALKANISEELMPVA